MQVGALAPYERALLTGGRLGLVDSLGRRHRLDVDRWVGGLDRADESVVRRCRAPVLDVGCGPGRFGAALARHGVAALGIDIAPGAVRVARRRGAHAVCRDLFDTAFHAEAPSGPEPARWRTVLLLDGNIGIGGDPRAVLHRAVELLAIDGEVIVEADGSPLAAAAAGGEELLKARFVDRAGRHEPVFDWAIVGPMAVRRHAWAAGLQIAESWTVGGRPFLRLTRG